MKVFSDNNPNINLSYGKDVYTDSDVISNTVLASCLKVMLPTVGLTMSLGQK